MRLIDADEIRWADHYDSDGNMSKYKVAYSDEMPPTVDAVPVIRCKDCKYFKRRSIYHHGLCDVHCNGIGEEEVTSEDQFCSWAERKEE